MEKPRMLALQLANQSQSEIPSTYVPERGLLTAVLERAVRDLGHNVTMTDRRTAIAWFMAVDEGTEEMKEGFTYPFIIRYLDLGKVEIDIINGLVSRAIEYQAQELKRKRRNENDVQIFPGD